MPRSSVTPQNEEKPVVQSEATMEKDKSANESQIENRTKRKAILYFLQRTLTTIERDTIDEFMKYVINRQHELLRMITSLEMEDVVSEYISLIDNPKDIQRDTVLGFSQYVLDLQEEFLRELTPEELKLAGLDYLDSVRKPNSGKTRRLIKNSNYKNV